ncbi:MAG: hypothetical protein KBB91_01980 [Candidatus Pacebacteria bacterium]|nr:hypothetical protein [Candidatus Paceibacterota bacterium]MBP9668094.1 hypothetical protein [Candidatus Saccharibacteria bacterium]
MENKQAQTAMDTNIPILFGQLLSIVDRALRLHFADDDTEPERLFLDTKHGTTIREMIVYQMLDHHPIIITARGNRPTAHMLPLQCSSPQQAASAEKILHAIGIFIKEQFAVTMSATCEAGNTDKVFCSF